MDPQKTHPNLNFLTEFVTRAIDSGIDLIQVREKDLPARDVFAVIQNVGGTNLRNAHLLVNDRVDIAAASGAGVHLSTRSLPAATVRRVFGDNILIGVSTHNFAEVDSAVEAGADFLVFGPVFETPSKYGYGTPVGLKTLRDAVARSAIPVLALGGIDLSNYRAVLDAGAAGVAGISMFVNTADIAELAALIKAG